MISIGYRVFLFLVLPPLYLWTWLRCWFVPFVWGQEGRGVVFCHQLVVRAEWKKGMEILVASAMDAGANVNDVRAAIRPYTPEEPK